MNTLLARSDEFLRVAIDAVRRGDDALRAALETLPAPIYVTDATGLITYFNTACVGFAGRRPAVGKDRWCVTWKLYAESGAFLPHDQCPMAVAIGTRTAIRGAYAVAERPDGSRVTFTPFPTPIFDADGQLVGAINMLIDVTESRQIAELQSQAARCRRLAGTIGDVATIQTLEAMAAEYEAKASALEAATPV